MEKAVKRIDLVEKLWSDERGWSVSFVRAAGVDSSEVGNFHIATIRPGCVRGNHRHPNSREWLVIIGGESLAAWRAGANDEDGAEPVSSEVPVMYEFSAGTAHAIQNTGQSDLLIVAFNDCSQPITEACKII